MNWSKRRVIVTGGAGFIGSSMVDKLLSLGASVTVVDKLLQSSHSWIWQAKLQRLADIYKKYGQDVQLELMDLTTDVEKFRLLCQNNDVVFHLSAVFGGREFVDTKEVECSAMLTVDHNAISAAQAGGIDRFHYASSACVYAPSMNRPDYLLKEDDILTTGEGWKSSDNLYGFAKLMGEMQLIAYHRERGFKTSASRYLTVYGPGELDATHAMAALIEKALSRQDPYEVWGSGEQERGFTYVDDIVEGSILACDKVEDGTAVNLGWDKRFKIRDVALKILDISGHRPKEIFYNKAKPEGPFSRALDISLAKQLTGWEPKVDLEEGLRRTIKWHAEIRGSEYPTATVAPHTV
jgi:nucleoside-diphosphate-sugar epimerase